MQPPPHQRPVDLYGLPAGPDPGAHVPSPAPAVNRRKVGWWKCRWLWIFIIVFDLAVIGFGVYWVLHTP